MSLNSIIVLVSRAHESLLQLEQDIAYHNLVQNKCYFSKRPTDTDRKLFQRRV